ncbi:MAG: CDP-glycerol glycerophosphotransferase family protein, partial [Clostridia bacterium]|nr:CDP-glycerol glycerophosphotransferase family protein [Clostridia bacterium]
MNRLLSAAFSLVNALVPKNKKRVVFCSFPTFSDNARAVYEEMVRQGLDARYRLVWLIQGETPPELAGATCLPQHSIKGMWQYFRAKYVFHTHGLFNNRPPRRQITVSLWHGMPLKTIMKLDATHPADEVFRFTYTLATSPRFQEVMAAAFDCPLERCLITG